MAIKLGGNRGSGIRSHRRAHPISDINVTPMVDVMLVLLVIFMVTAPLLTVGVPVDLPQTKAEAMQDPEEPVVVTIDAKGKVYLQETELTIEALGPRISAISGANPEVKIFVRADKNVDYGTVLVVMGELTAAGFTHLALISDSAGTSPGQNKPSGTKPKPSN